MFFIISSTMGMTMFKTYSDKPFQLLWWFWLIWTGFFLACSIGFVIDHIRLKLGLKD